MGPCHISHSANLPSPHLCVSCGLSQPPCFTTSSLKAVASGYSSSQHRYLAPRPGQSFSTLSLWTYYGDQPSRSQSEGSSQSFPPCPEALPSLYHLPSPAATQFLNCMQYNGGEVWWKTVKPLVHVPVWLSPHTLLPSPARRIPPHQATSCSQSLYPSNPISIFQKRSVWCIHLTWKFSAWMVRLKLYLKTGSSEVSDNLDRRRYQLCIQCSWVSSCHIELDREFSQSAKWSAPVAISNKVLSSGDSWRICLPQWNSHYRMQ